MNAAKSTNTIGLAERQGMFRSTPVLAADVGKPGFADALAARGPQTLQAANAYDGNIVPFKPDEASALKTAWGQMGPGEKASLAATMAANLKDPRVYEAAIGQVAGANRLELTAGLLGGRDPALAQKILIGGEMMKDKGVETKIQGVRAAITNTIPVGLFVTPQTNSDVAMATAAVYAANKADAHALIDPLDTAGIKSAMEEVTGATTTINGRATAIPKPYSVGAVHAAIGNVTDADLKPFGGLQPGMSAEWLRSHGQLQARRIGGDDYTVYAAGKPVFTADGRPLTIGLGAFVAHQKAQLELDAETKGVGRAQRGDPAARAQDALDTQAASDLGLAGRPY